jgi:hypothetical protein
MSTYRYQWLAASLHAVLFVIMWLTVSGQSPPTLDGTAANILLVADFPISVIGFSMLWDGKGNSGFLFWGVAGTVWWYLLLTGIQWVIRKARQTS